MTTIQRSSGVVVTVSGSIDLDTPRAGPIKRGKGRPPRALSLATSDVLIAELGRQDLELVDAVPLAKRERPGVKRGPGAPPRSASLEVAVPVGSDENAIVLIEDEGEYRWLVNGKKVEDAGKRIKRGTKAPKPAKRIQFTIELEPSKPAPRKGTKRGKVKRGWVADKVAEKVVAYVFRFAVKLAGKKLVQFLERKLARGLVAIGAGDPATWELMADDQALTKRPPEDRSARVLLLVHGTFSSTVGSYGALSATAEGRDFLARALQKYDYVLGYDHRTLSVDPAENATEILDRLRAIAWPQPPTIDLVAFSRGGLVARWLTERLLPTSGWQATIGQLVFVGCTNAGTQLAEPENWHRFVDHYTNMALGAARALSLIPGVQAWTTIASQGIRGVAALVKALATGAITDNVAPGLAAMEPDGEFVRTINAIQPGQQMAADARSYAVTSNFEAASALSAASAPELPAKLLLRIANWGADELYGEPNDLVVHVNSMTELDADSSRLVKDRLEYGANGAVYHTNYFAQPRTAAQLTKWFGLPVARAERVVKRAPSPLAFRVAKEGSRYVGTALGDATLSYRPVAYEQRSTEAPAVRGAKKSPKKKSPKKGPKKAARRGPPKPSRPTFAQPIPKARDGVNPFTGASVFRVKPPERWRRIRADVDRRDSAGFKRASVGVHKPMGGGGGGRVAPPVKRGGRATSAGKRSASVECRFRAVVDSQVVVKQPTSVELTIAREAIEAAAGKISAGGRAEVRLDSQLIVELAAHRGFRVEGQRRFDVDVPEPGQRAFVQFKVIGDTVGEGELSIQVRQGSVPLVTLWLTPQIVARLGGPSARQWQTGKVERLPEAQPPLDELRIHEYMNGKGVGYYYQLDLHSLGIRQEFESPAINMERDAYVTRLMNDIGDSWIATKSPGPFEDAIRAIGGQMFDQLFPREMQELLWEKRDDFKSVQVFSREPFIPWELVYLKDPRKRVAERGNKFLGELGLLRWLYDGFPPSKLRIRRSRVRYLISDVTGDNMELPEAEAEGGLLRKKLGGTAVNPDLEDLSPLLQKPGSFDLLHICCHGHAAGKDSAQAQLYITGIFEDGRFMGQTLQATTVQQTASLAEPDAEHRPIVVVNACESGRPNREFNGMGGFAHAFVRARAGAFIGTHWSVGDAPALAFVEALYDSFLGKKRKKPVTLSAAVIKAREKARANQDATWLAYVVYGHPHAEVTVE